MKPFNIEEYLENPSRKVVTRSGDAVKILCTDFDDSEYPIIARVEGASFSTSFTKDGKYYGFNNDSKYDLFFAPERHEGWVSIFRGKDGPLVGDIIFNSKEDAEESSRHYCGFTKGSLHDDCKSRMGGIIMQPFSLDKYLKNPLRKVITRDGRTVRIICTDFNNINYPIVIEVEGLDAPMSATREGRHISFARDEKLDLFFAPEKHERYVNIVEDEHGDSYAMARIFESKKDAEKMGKMYDGYIATTKIEWEE